MDLDDRGMRGTDSLSRVGGSQVRRLAVVVSLAVLLAATGSGWTAGPFDDQAGIDAPWNASADHDDWAATPTASLDDETLDLLAATVAGALTGGQPVTSSTVPGGLSGEYGPVFAALRAGGTNVASAWADGTSPLEAVAAAVATAAAKDDAGGATIDTVELCLSHSYRSVDPDGDGRGLLTNAHVGVLGLEVEHEGDNGRYSPTMMLANNWDFDDTLARFADANGLDAGNLGADVRLRVFGCDQVLVTLGDPLRATPMERGNALVPLALVTEAGVAELADLLGGWLTRNLHPDGRMTYTYWPSVGEESDANNMIRQWMATVALTRFARARGDDPALYEQAARNIRYNLDHFYREEDGLGLIAEPDDGEVKLGAVALAALAIVEHPRRADFAREENALRRTVDHLWQADGSFRTFYLPADRNDNQNFYPGEALLLWATLYWESHDSVLLERFLASFRYYRTWHLDEANRNPAFIPWHTQAYYTVWRETKDPALRDFVFTMNDWLLSIQQWETALYPDLQGRFYDPDRPEYGRPHASATGVYLEGLIDAYRLAVEVGDADRVGRYRLAIRRGLRNVMQLQFADEIDLYYVEEPERVLGGVRTEVYDNAIRVDNVQHNLMGILKILDTFSAADFVG